MSRCKQNASGFILFIDSNETPRQTFQVKRIYSSPIVPCFSFAPLHSPSSPSLSLCYHPRQIVQSDKVESPGLMFNYESRFTSLFTIRRWRCVNVSLYNIFLSRPCQCLAEPFVLRSVSKLRFSLSLIYITCDTGSSWKREREKRGRKRIAKRRM